MVELVHGLHHRSPKVVKLVHGLHHGCLGGDHGCPVVVKLVMGASPWVSNGGEARSWASPRWLH